MKRPPDPASEPKPKQPINPLRAILKQHVQSGLLKVYRMEDGKMRLLKPEEIE